MSFLNVLGGGLLDLLAPRMCPGCDLAMTAPDDVFCGACTPLLERCSVGSAAFVFAGPLADAIRRFKYERRTDFTRSLAALLCIGGLRHAGLVDAIVPVPLHPRKLRERGFNQAALIASPLARVLGVPLQVIRLRRTRPTAPQMNLPHAERMANVRGAFLAKSDSKKSRVLLVDDVHTTGATLAACADALRNAGTREVRLLTLAAAP